MTPFKYPLFIYRVVYVAGILVLLVAFWFAFIIYGPGKSSAKTVAPYAPLTKSDLYAPEDHARFFQIGTALQEKYPVSDADLNYAIALLKRGPVTKTPWAESQFLMFTLSQLFNHGSMTPKQQHILAEVLVPYAADPPPDERAPIDGITAVAVSLQDVAVLDLGSLNDEAATAKLKDLSQRSATLKIRQTAGGGLLRQRKRQQTAK